MVAQHQVRIWLAFESKRLACLVQQVCLTFRATLRNEGVNHGVASLIFHEFNVRGAHDLEHIGLSERVRVYLGTSVEVADSVQLALVARTNEAHAWEHGEGMEPCDQVVLVQPKLVYEDNARRGEIPLLFRV